MANPAPPRIFDTARRKAAVERAKRGNGPHYVRNDMVDDVIERLGFLRLEPRSALVIGDMTGQLAEHLRGQDADVREYDVMTLDEEQPYPESGFDLIASVGSLDTVNDLPGALVHIRQALAPEGLMIASFVGSGSLEALRQVMLVADGDRPSARMHPLVDVRAGAQLLQRAGFADPVADAHSVRVRFSSLQSLVGDLRSQGFGSALTDRAPPLDRAARRRAIEAFEGLADSEGKVLETFEILTLSGRRPKARF